MTWTRSDLTAHGLGRGLILGTPPDHAAPSMLGNGYIVTDKSGTTPYVDLLAWCVKRGVDAPTKMDLAWLRGGG